MSTLSTIDYPPFTITSGDIPNTDWATTTSSTGWINYSLPPAILFEVCVDKPFDLSHAKEAYFENIDIQIHETFLTLQFKEDFKFTIDGVSATTEEGVRMMLGQIRQRSMVKVELPEELFVI